MIKLYILIALFYSSCLNGYLGFNTENDVYIDNDNINIMTNVIDYLPAPNCPLEHEKYSSKCNPNSRYRTADGTCNNLLYSWWGAKDTPYKRYLKPAYDDGYRTPRTFSKKRSTFLANSRFLADKLFPAIPTEINLNMDLMFFGQYLTHDISNSIPTQSPCSCYSKSNECFNIVVPIEDAVFNGTECLPFLRNADISTIFDCEFKQREQGTLNSHWLDCNNLYGPTLEATNSIRKFKRGLLLSSRTPGSKYESLPIKNKTICMDTTKKTAGCFFAGDNRFEQHVFLTQMHVLFLRLHNKFARELSIINPQWSDETIFQETRRILIAINAQIIYSEWLPIIIGDKLMKQFELYPLTEGYLMNYNKNIYPQLSNEFVVAAQRLHIFVHNKVHMADLYLNNIFKTDTDPGDLDYYPLFFNQSESYFRGDLYGRAGLLDTSYKQRLQMADSLNNQLNKDFPNLGDHSSLGAINIQRGRDHGVRGYNYYRKFCGFKFAKSFNDFNDTISQDLIGELRKFYLSPSDVDLYVGLSAESPVGDSLVGPTSGCILARQYRDLKYGDRHFYENGNNPRTRFTLEQLNEIRHYTFARANCDAFGLFKVQKEAFYTADLVSNPYVRCSDVPDIDLKWWAAKKSKY